MGNVIVRRLLTSMTHPKLILFSTSGISKTNVLMVQHNVRSTNQLRLLMKCAVVISAQGSQLTASAITKLRRKNWSGYWTDAASFLRTKHNVPIALDPVNNKLLEDAIIAGVKSFVGGNCTVSLMLMGIGSVIQMNLAKQLFVTTFQSASGAGVLAVHRLLEQIVTFKVTNVSEILNNKTSPEDDRGVCSVLPWIDDSTKKIGTTREELKGSLELRKIMTNLTNKITISSVCVRVNVIRCHSQSITMRLERNFNLSGISDVLQSFNCWVKLIPNLRGPSEYFLVPNHVSCTFIVLVGRLKRTAANYVTVFTIGDQLLWGAAEPIVRVTQAVRSSVG